MTEPTTAEGRALLDEMPDTVVAGGSVAEYVLAIEAAAAEAERARIRAAVEGLPNWKGEFDGLGTAEFMGGMGFEKARAAVLAAIDDEAKGEPEHRPEGNEGYCACGTWVWESRRNPWRCPAAIDDETLHERQVRLNYERPGSFETAARSETSDD